MACIREDLGAAGTTSPAPRTSGHPLRQASASCGSALTAFCLPAGSPKQQPRGQPAAYPMAEVRSGPAAVGAPHSESGDENQPPRRKNAAAAAPAMPTKRLSEKVRPTVAR